MIHIKFQKLKIYFFLLTLSFYSICLLETQALDSTSPPHIRFYLALESEEKELKVVSVEHLLRPVSLKSTEEKDPQTGIKESWKGILITQTIEKILEPLPLEQKSQVDLLRFEIKNKDASNVISEKYFDVPRALITKYPVLLGFKSTSRIFNSQPLNLILPWSSQPRIFKEGLPLENYWLSGIHSIYLMNYNHQFKSYLLKKRTDPLAIRGEKLFIRNCIQCQNGNKNSSIGSELLNTMIKDKHSFSEKEQQSLERYFHLFTEENNALL